MHLQSCLNPQKVYNKYIDEYVYVPCRKCEACRNIRRQELVSDIQDMCKCHTYNHFFTLTYSNENCSTLKVVRSDDTGTILSGCVDSSYDCMSYVCHDLTDEMLSNNWNDYDIEYLNSKDIIRVGSKHSVQKFIKRLRKYVQENFEKDFSFDYFVCLEYSPKLHRPHYHGIFSHDNPQVCQAFRQILDEVWQLGRTNTTIAGNASLSYVAKYINSFTYLPKVYDSPEWRPFFIRSRRTFNSSSLSSSAEIQNVVFGNVNYYVRMCDGKANVVSFSRSLEDRLFPKCKEFNRKSHSERVSTYRQAENILEKAKIIGCSPLEAYQSYTLSEYLYGNDFSVNDFYVSKRVLENAAAFKVSLDWYVKRIEDYYNFKEQEALKRMYEFEIDFMDKNIDIGNYSELKYLVSLYPNLYDKLKTCRRELLDIDKYVEILRDFGIEKTDIPLLDFRKSADFQDFSALHIHIDKTSQKTKVLNEHFINF